MNSIYGFAFIVAMNIRIGQLNMKMKVLGSNLKAYVIRVNKIEGFNSFILE
jgi:hypothetical protein